MAQERLDKIIASMTQYSRREVRSLIRSGQVLLNGTKASSPETKCDPQTEHITVCGRKLTYEAHVYLMLNKPAGVVTATRDDRNPTVMEFLSRDDRIRPLFPVGRLDKDSEGLLLITDDGDLAHKLLSPSKHVEKQYLVTVEGRLGKEETEAFARGVVLANGSSCMEARLEILEERTLDGMITTEAMVTIREGMYHQIKRMFGVFQKPVLSLKRIRMGSLTLDPELSPGEVRRLTDTERTALMALVKQAETS